MFESKGKRDSHHRKEHQNRYTIPHCEALNSRTRDSNDGALTCVCGRRYQHARSLNRHRTSCTRWNLMGQGEIAREESPEGNTFVPSYRDEGKALR